MKVYEKRFELKVSYHIEIDEYAKRFEEVTYPLIDSCTVDGEEIDPNELGTEILDLIFAKGNTLNISA